jgi:hypothetical protein
MLSAAPRELGMLSGIVGNAAGADDAAVHSQERRRGLMRRRDDPMRVTATCDFCWTVNELTIAAVPNEQPIHCSTCGGALGSLGELRHRNGMVASRELNASAPPHQA